MATHLKYGLILKKSVQETAMERLKFVPSENAKIGLPAAPLETKISVPAPEVAAEGADATVNVGSLISPTKPSEDVTGPENVVDAIINTPCTRFRLAVCATSGRGVSCLQG